MFCVKTKLLQPAGRSAVFKPRIPNANARPGVERPGIMTETHDRSILLSAYSAPAAGKRAKYEYGSAGCVIPTINDDHKRQAPDIGMVEYGDEAPHYGPWPLGTKE
jgi:hypothetical protein